MKQMIVVSVCLCVISAAQVTSTGEGRYSGAWVWGVVQVGAPLSYPSARTDECETGYEPGCSGKGMHFTLTSSETGPFSQLAPMNTAAIDPDFGSYQLIASDWTVKSYVQMWAATDGCGFSLDASFLILCANTGAIQIVRVNEPAIVAAASGGTPCSTRNCVTTTSITTGNPGSCVTGCTLLDNGGTQRWSSIAGEGNVLYELSANQHTVYKLTIGPDNKFRREPYLDLTGSGGIPSNYIGTGWAPFGINPDGSFMSAMGGAPPWVSATAYSAWTDIIWPQNSPAGHNAGRYAFEAITSGTSYSSEPVWANAQNANDTICDDAVGAVNTSCAAGVVTWQNIRKIEGQGNSSGNGDAATYSGPFDFINYRPGKGLSRLNIRTGKITRADGSTEPSGSWTTDHPLICAKYGYSPCPLTEFSVFHAGGGVNSQFAQWTPTNGQSGGCLVKGTCSSVLDANQYRGAWQVGTTYAAKDVVYMLDSDATNPTLPDGTKYYPVYKSKTGSNAGCKPTATVNPTDCNYNNAKWDTAGNSEAYGGNYIWEVGTTIIRPLMRTSGLSEIDGHSVRGNIYLMKGGSGGAQMWEHKLSVPNVLCTINGNPEAVPNPTAMINGVDTSVCQSGRNGVALLTQSLPSDQHAAWANDDSLDRPPFGMSLTDVPAQPNFDALCGQTGHKACSSVEQAWYGELVMGATGRGPDPIGTTYRMSHTYNTGDNPTYNGQNNWATVSSDGVLAAITTDIMGTRGSQNYRGSWSSSLSYSLWDVVLDGGSYYVANNLVPAGGVAPHLDSTDWALRGANGCNNLRADSKWSSNLTVTAGYKVMTVTGNDNIFQVDAASTGWTTGTSQPNWNSCKDPMVNGVCAPGNNCTCTESSGVIWNNIGQNDCRTDVMIVYLLSAH